MINYTWKVTELYTQTIEGKEDYVVLAHCETIGVDGEFTASVPNVIQFSTEEVTNFIPYKDLTEELIVGWIKEVLTKEEVLYEDGVLDQDGVLAIEESIADQIAMQKNPPVTLEITPLPWS
jgi:hypothetical protein